MRRIGLLTTLWTALLFFPASSVSLGLGEIEVSTFLNQPLKAEIEVLSARPGEIDDLLVSLASREAFDKAGLERPADLSRLRFKVEKSEDGQNARVLVSTKTPVKEPFLNFLVEADWAKGRLLREFTILLDPPHFAQQAAAAQASPAPAAAAEPAQPKQPSAGQSQFVEPAPLAEVVEPQGGDGSSADFQPIASSQSSSPAPRESSARADDTASYAGGAPDAITVGKGDTLWSIASQFKDDAHSMAQVMLAMQAVNPEAFGNDNINNLKVGSVLRAPGRAEIDRLSKQQAYAQVLEQNGLWDDYLARKSGSVSRGSPAQPGTEGQTGGAESDSRLSLMAPGDSDSTSASFQSGVNSEEAGQMRKQLALAEEELEAARLQNEDLKSRITDLEKQLEKFAELKNLVEIEDSTLARMQDSIAAQQSETPAAGMVDQPVADEQADAPSETMVQAAESIMLEEQQTESAMSESVTDSASESDMVMGPEPAGEQQSMQQGAMQDNQDVVVASADAADEGNQDTQTPPAPPIIITEPPASGGEDGLLGMLPSLDSLLGDPVMLGGLGGIVVLLLVLLMLKRKKAAQEDSDSGLLIEEPADEGIVDDDATPIHVPAESDAAEQTAEMLDESTLGDTAIIEPGADQNQSGEDDDQFSSTAIISAEDMPDMQEQAVEEEQDDVLNEIDVYLAYGLYDNAEELLKESLENSPDRADYRAKLLDTYFATKNRNGFVKEAEALKSLGGAADRYWDRVQIMGYELDPSNSLFAGGADSELSAADLQYAKPETPDFDVGGDSDELDLTGTDFDFGIDSEADEFDAASTQVMGEAADAAGDAESVDDELMGDFDLPDLDDIDLELSDDKPKQQAEHKSAGLDDGLGDLDVDVASESDGAEGTDSLQFDLPDDLDLSDTNENIDALGGNDVALDFDTTGELSIDLDAGPGEDASAVGEPESLLSDATADIELPAEIASDEQSDDDIEIMLDESSVAEPTSADDLDLEIAGEPELDIGAEFETASAEQGDETMMLEADLEDAIDRSDDDVSIVIDEAADGHESANSEADMDLADLQAGESSGEMDGVFAQNEDEIITDSEVEELSPEEVITASAAVDDLEDEMQFSAQPSNAEEDLLDTVGDQNALDEDFEMEDVSEIDIDMSDFESTGDIAEFDVDAAILAEEVDTSAGLDKTGTFAPGDFSEDEEQEVSEDRTYSSISDVDDIEDLMLPQDVDEVSTKLDLARAFIDMGDAEGARSSLEEVLEEGDEEQKAEARELLERMN